jgi:hypothetical protein
VVILWDRYGRFVLLHLADLKREKELKTCYCYFQVLLSAMALVATNLGWARPWELSQALSDLPLELSDLVLGDRRGEDGE